MIILLSYIQLLYINLTCCSNYYHSDTSIKATMSKKSKMTKQHKSSKSSKKILIQEDDEGELKDIEKNTQDDDEGILIYLYVFY